VHGDRGEWTQLLDVAEDLLPRLVGEEKLYVAIQAGQIAFDKANDIARARKFFAAAASVESQNPSVQDFVAAVGLDEISAAGSMPTMPAAREDDDDAKARAHEEAEKTAKAERQAQRDAERRREEDEEARAQADAEAKSRDDRAAAAAAAVAAEVMPAAETQPTGRTEKPVKAPVAAPAIAVPATLEDAMKRARASENTPDKGIPAWKDIIAKNPTERAPRRELARVLRSHNSWAQLADALKDEEQKTVHSSPEKAEMFLELAETYGKLNNDNQVMAALTAALQQDPQRLEIYDRLGSLYEAKKRWPDLVKVLTEKAERTEGTPNKVAIFLQIANLYLERFSNQAEAIKAFERVLDLDPHNQEAINHLLAVYEKRRDWEKLIRLKEAEVERTDPKERSAKVIEVAKMAATRVKKPEITTYWWEKVLEVEPTHDEALTELSKLYARNKE
jgi:tetratricopeptide (TPR) repeat protein